MAKIRYAEGLKCLPIIAPVAFTTSAIESEYVDMETHHWGSFHIAFGDMTSDSTDTVTVTVECSTAASSNATEVNLAFDYRLSSAVATDSMGAITSATTTGVSITATDDAKLLIVEVNPDTIPAALTDGKFLRIVATPSDAVASGVISAVAYLEPRYPANLSPSST